MFSDVFRSTAIIFVLITIFIFLIRPPIFFEPNGQVKSFGFQLKNNETPLTLVMFIYGLMILIYVLISYIDFKINR